MNEPITTTCHLCNGSGEGIADGTICPQCRGKGSAWTGRFVCPECDKDTLNQDGPCDDCVEALRQDNPPMMPQDKPAEF